MSVRPSLIGGAAMLRTAKVIRDAIMAEELLAEMRQAPLDQAGQMQLREMLDISVGELSTVLPPGLADELGRIVRPAPSEASGQEQLRLAHARLKGWLEGVLWGIQAHVGAFAAESAAAEAPRSLDL
jgi:hypothetical protein